MNNIKIQQWLIGIFSALLIVTLMIVASVETKKSKEYKPEIDVDKISARCILCHEKENIAVKQIDAWEGSEHAIMGIGCNECHEAKEDDFDAQRCPESDFLIARHPTPKDCAECHEHNPLELDVVQLQRIVLNVMSSKLLSLLIVNMHINSGY